MSAFRPASLLLVILAACADRSGDTGSAGGAATGGTVVIVTPGSGSSPMIPSHSTDIYARIVADAVHERLAEIGPDMNAVGDRGFTPRLARSWTWAADSMSVAFALNPLAKWHDGRPVRASDVRFSLSLLKDPKAATQYTSLLQNIDSVSVRDSLTAVAWFRKRSPEQFYEFVHQVFVLPEHILKDIPRDKLAASEAATHPIGSGRFRFARFEPGVRVEIVADTSHYRGRPKLDRVIVSFVGDPGAALTKVFNGEGDYYENLPAAVLPRVDSAGNVRAVRYPGLGYIYLGMNYRNPKRIAARHPIFEDIRVRRAVSMALDRQSMLRNVFDTLGMLGIGPVTRALGDTTITLPAFDRARASALLDSAGWLAGAGGIRAKGGRPLRFGILVPASSPPRVRYAVLIQEQLKAIGAQVDIESIDIAAFGPRLEGGDFDAVLMGLNTDPSRISAARDWAANGAPPAGKNYVRFANRTFDALVDSAASSFDPARADAYYHRAMQTIVDDVPGVWLYDVLTLAIAHKRLRPEGMRPDAWWAGLDEWWIPANERIDRDRIGLRPPTQP